MARRGARVPDAIREKVRAHFTLNNNLSAAAAEFNLSVSTVHGIVRQKPRPVRDPAASNTATSTDTSAADVVTMTELDVRAAAWPRLVGPLVPKIERVLEKLGQADTEANSHKSLTGQLYSLSLSFAILVDKARLLNEKATSITARAEELTKQMPEGLSKDFLIAIIRRQIGSASEHPGLLEAAASDR